MIKIVITVVIVKQKFQGFQQLVIALLEGNYEFSSSQDDLL